MSTVFDHLVTAQRLAFQAVLAWQQVWRDSPTEENALKCRAVVKKYRAIQDALDVWMEHPWASDEHRNTP